MVGESQGAVPGTEARLARVTVVVSTTDPQRPQDALEGLVMAAGVTSWVPTARAGERRPCIVGVIGVEPGHHGLGSDLQCLAADRGLDRLEIPALQWTADQRLDFGGAFGREVRAEPFFSAPSWEAASPSRAAQSASLVSMNSLLRARNRSYSAS